MATLRRAMPRAFGASPTVRLGLACGWLAFAGLIVLCLWRLETSPQRLWQGLGKMGWLVPLMLPPTPGGWLLEFCYAMLETLAMAFLGTLLASLVALPLGFLGANNVVPQVLPNITSYTLLRFEINVRASSVVGFVGAGGIGQELYTVIRQFIYVDISAIVLLLIVTVAILDILCEQLRHHLIGAQALP